MMRAVLLIFSAFLLSGCTWGNWNSIHRTPNITDGTSQIVDAKQRFVLTYKVPSNDPHGVARYISCAEPSPDVFSVFAASGELSVNAGTEGGSGSFVSSETGASLLNRTPIIQAQRDIYFRLCEAYANGAIDEIDLMIGQRHNQTSLVGMLAIEEMNALAKSPPVVIGGSASATSASGLRELSTQIERLTTEVQEIEEKKAKKTARIDEIDKEISGLKPAANKEAAPDEKEAQKKIEDAKKQISVLTEERSSLKKELSADDAIIEAKNKSITSLLVAMEKGGITGTSAQSVVQGITGTTTGTCGADCLSKRVEIADKMLQVVNAIDDNDFGATICLSSLRKPKTSSLPTIKTINNVDNTTTTQPIIARVCNELLAEYVASIKERRLSREEVRRSIKFQEKLLLETIVQIESTSQLNDAEVEKRLELLSNQLSTLQASYNELSNNSDLSIRNLVSNTPMKILSDVIKQTPEESKEDKE